MGFRDAGLAAVLLLLASAPSAAAIQAIPIAGVELRLLQKTGGVLRVIIENTQDSPLTAVHLLLSPAHGVLTHAANFDAPVVKGERRTIDIDLRSNPDISSATFGKATFSDGGVLGGPAVAQRLTLVSVERLAQLTYSALIVNRRPVPIEAFGLEEIAPYETRVLRAHRMDFALADPATPRPGVGRIAPGEEREVRLQAQTQAESVKAPVVRLSFVLYEDLSFEGRQDARNELFAAREKTAEAVAAALEAVRQAAALPDGQAIPFLERRRAEWAASRSYEAHLLEEVLGGVGKSTVPFERAARFHTDYWEQQLTRLLRRKQEHP